MAPSAYMWKTGSSGSGMICAHPRVLEHLDAVRVVDLHALDRLDDLAHRRPLAPTTGTAPARGRACLRAGRATSSDSVRPESATQLEHLPDRHDGVVGEQELGEDVPAARTRRRRRRRPSRRRPRAGRPATPWCAARTMPLPLRDLLHHARLGDRHEQRAARRPTRDSSRTSRSSVVSGGIAAPFSSISHTRSAALSITTPRSAPTARHQPAGLVERRAAMSRPRRLGLESTKAFSATISTPEVADERRHDERRGREAVVQHEPEPAARRSRRGRARPGAPGRSCSWPGSGRSASPISPGLARRNSCRENDRSIALDRRVAHEDPGRLEEPDLDRVGVVRPRRARAGRRCARRRASRGGSRRAATRAGRRR